MSNLQANANFAVYIGKVSLKLNGVRSPFNSTNTKLIFSFDANGNSISWNPTNPTFLNTLSELKPNTGYYLILLTSITLDEFAPSFQPAIATGTKYFLDSVNGNDTNNGISINTPFKTFAKLKQQTITSGTTIYLARGSHWREEFFLETSGLSIIAYGSGQKPIVDGSDIVPNNNFSTDATYPNTRKIDWTLVSAIEAGASFRIGVWENDRRLKRTFSLEECNTTVGSFFSTGQLSDGSIQTTGGGQTTTTVYVNPTGVFNNNIYEITKRVLCIGLGDNGLVDGLHTTKHAINDGSIRLYYNATIKNCLATWGAKHHFYLQSGIMENCQALKVSDPDCIPFIAFTPILDSADYIFRDCIAVRESTDPIYTNDQTQGWYAHGVLGVDPGDVTIERCEVYNHGAAFTAASDTLTLKNSYAENCAKAVATGSSINTLIEKNEFKNCNIGVEVYFTTSPVIIKNNKIYGNTGYAVFIGINTPVTIENNVFETIRSNTYGVYLLQSTNVAMSKTIINGFQYPWNVISQNYALLNLTKNLYFPAPIMSVNFSAENFTQWKAHNIDLDSIVADPKFLDAAPVFSLKTDSPAIPLGAGLIQ